MTKPNKSDTAASPAVETAAENAAAPAWASAAPAESDGFKRAVAPAPPALVKLTSAIADRLAAGPVVLDGFGSPAARDELAKLLRKHGPELFGERVPRLTAGQTAKGAALRLHFPTPRTAKVDK